MLAGLLEAFEALAGIVTIEKVVVGMVVVVGQVWSVGGWLRRRWSGKALCKGLAGQADAIVELMAEDALND